MRISALALLALIPLGCFGQTASSRIPFVRAVGMGTVNITPDQAQIDVGVITQAATATATSTENASQVTSVIAALTALLGASANIKTVSYSLTANYSYPQNGQPTLTGYTANNTVQITVNDLTVIGKVIDTSIQAGANQVVGLQFGLKDDSAARAQALQLATVQAKASANAMAGGLGLHTGAVQVIEEGSTITPQLIAPAAGSAVPTPIQAGTLTIQASVTLDVSLTQ